MAGLLRTGVDSLDELLSGGGPTLKQHGIALESANTATSLCVVGPDGTGKSILAMHVASHYVADCVELGKAPPCALYVSTDLTHTMARSMWRGFALDRPNSREVPFRVPQRSVHPLRRPHLRVDLHERSLTRLGDLARDLARGSEVAQVSFVDLAAQTSGDDWAFVHRLIGLLPPLEPNSPRHLLVIDAIEGLETFAGEMDSFGQKTTRRARIAKLMRLVHRRAHVVMVVEESHDDVKLAEQFVADTVIRLRISKSGDYLRRTLEIEKARGQPHVRGHHPYVIRKGTGSTTGDAENHDDPRVKGGTQAYLTVFPSLHFLSRQIMDIKGAGVQSRPAERAAFGIKYLDQMLDKADGEARTGSDDWGLPCSTITALIGDAGTRKTGLGLCFLGQAFGGVLDEISRRMVQQSRKRPPATAELLPMVKKLLESSEIKRKSGIAVLISTHDESREKLIHRFLDLFRDHRRAQTFKKLCVPGGMIERAILKFIEERTICRRLEIHDTPSSVLFHTIQRAVQAAQTHVFRELGHLTAPAEADKRFDKSWRIRLVIDDFSTMVDTFAQVRSDPLFLPFLLFYLKREGLSTLIVDTRPGGPEVRDTEGFHTELRALSDYRIFTWPISAFFGDHRVAIAPIPPIAREHRVRVREVRPYHDPEALGRHSQLIVDPDFELYSGLEKNAPQLVPLRVHLYGETAGCVRYADYLNKVFVRAFGQNALGEAERVVIAEKAESYNTLRDASYLQMDTMLDHTMIVQVDEFWPHGQSLRDETRYLHESVVGGRDRHADDPYSSFRQTRLASKKKDRYCKADFFQSPSCSVERPEGQETADPSVKVDRIPFIWDFGFLACRDRAWEDAINQASPKERRTLAAFWRRYRKGRHVDWIDFLSTASRVAELTNRGQTKVPPFDLSMTTPESMSSLLLEMWFSEILKTAKSRKRFGNQSELDEVTRLIEQVRIHRWKGEKGHSLVSLLSGKGRLGAPVDFPGYALELYKAWLMLAEALPLGKFENHTRAYGFNSETNADPMAVASRQWYHTTGFVEADDYAKYGSFRYCRLPGHFSTRGDWFLAVMNGSRSDRLADRALDLMCSTRGNMRRLLDGVGLPTRRLTEKQSLKALEAFRGRLITSGEQNISTSLKYRHIIELGPHGAPETPFRIVRSDFNWLWRSQITGYHRHASAWQSWLYRLTRRWDRLREHEGAKWISGFDLYAEICAHQAQGTKVTGRVLHLRSWKGFLEMVSNLVAELEQSDPPSEGRR